MNKSTANYAEQLFEIARKANVLEDAREEFNAITLAIDEQPKFIELLATPTLDLATKRDLIEATFSTKISKIMKDFIGILVEERIVENILEIGKLYHALVSQYLEDHFGILEGKLYSAVSMDEAQLLQLEEVLTIKIGKKVKLNLEIDESLIAGYRVSVGNMVYDSTVKLQLKQLKESLMNVDLG